MPAVATTISRAFLTLYMDTNQDAIRAANKSAREAKSELNYYRGLAGSYQLLHQQETQCWRAISAIEGITYELLQELHSHAAKYGYTERVQKSLSRLMIFDEQIGVLSKIQMDNYTLSLALRDERIGSYQLREKIIDLNRRLQLHTENL